MLSETWLHDNFFNSELNQPNYRIFRCDRGKTGGGVLIAVNLELNSKEIDHATHLDICGVEINFESQKVLICSVYIPPGFECEILLKY